MDLGKLLSDTGELKKTIGEMGKTECVLAYAFLKDQVERAERVKTIVSSVIDDVVTRLGDLGVNIGEGE